MAAKIIPFPTDSRVAAQGTPRATDGDAALDLVIELVDAEPPLTHTVSVHAATSLADVHLLITRLFGWDNAHNYFFSYGSCRFEDPELFRSHDRLSARCRKIYSAADIPLGDVLGNGADSLFYVYDLVNCWEVRISRAVPAQWRQFG